jgi:oxygen-independent coproporphyrinogen-3 oxidase
MSVALYIHLPFCRVHCTYCAFAISTDQALQDAYVEALLREIDARATGERVTTLYFGGGTPSRTSLADLERIASRIRERFDVAPAGEFSIEANPEDIDDAALAAWRAIGVNRVSIGVQSFADEELRAIGRVHDAAAARAAVARAVSSGLRTSLDLILGLPGQTCASFAATLDEAVALGAGHLSLYMLDLEERTPLEVQVTRGRIVLPEDDLVASAYLDGVQRLAEAGLAQSEISNFAREGEKCAHNLVYWNRGTYYGFGIGAHSFAGERRFANTRDIRRYIAAPEAASDFSESLGAGEQSRETLFLALRQAAGMCYDVLVRLTGQEGIEWVTRGLDEGWLRRSGERVAFTPAGFLLSNDYISQLF